MNPESMTVRDDNPKTSPNSIDSLTRRQGVRGVVTDTEARGIDKSTRTGFELKPTEQTGQTHHTLLLLIGICMAQTCLFHPAAEDGLAPSPLAQVVLAPRHPSSRVWSQQDGKSKRPFARGSSRLGLPRFWEHTPARAPARARAPALLLPCAFPLVSANIFISVDLDPSQAS
ncbi:hypothetical protein C8034_v005609 [Colletotrichum sidae]|uniref:Uncharacterized protein n=1 Tax=Colletotrichum sidae TaxID=1347389 RepID=A0A4R8T6E7_9PEZI|nr:hypothetical protein C8034_v005609 [Colletotrichum sidae]